jgi:hypothetical protein
MNSKNAAVLKRILSAPFFSPAGLTRRALLIALLFAICHLLGWREHTTFLSGTPADASIGVGASAVLGLIYMATYFGVVLLTPILLLASLLLLAWDSLSRSGTDGVGPSSGAATNKHSRALGLHDGSIRLLASTPDRDAKRHTEIEHFGHLHLAAAGDGRTPN